MNGELNYKWNCKFFLKITPEIKSKLQPLKLKKNCCQIYQVLLGIRTDSVQHEGSFWCLLTGATLQPVFIALPTATETLPHKPNALNSTST